MSYISYIICYWWNRRLIQPLQVDVLSITRNDNALLRIHTVQFLPIHTLHLYPILSDCSDMEFM